MKFRVVFFDVDSTLVTIEGIDVLAGDNPEIVALTNQAMNGEIALEDVYARRLEIIRPTRVAIDALAERYLESIVDGAQEVVSELLKAGAIVHLVSAGIEQAIAPLAQTLGVRNIHAVKLQFDEEGNYRDFDRRSSLTRSRGKELVVRDIRARTKGKAAFIGDGASDLEAKGGVDLFVGFGGVVVRGNVKEKADAYVTSMRDLARLLW